MTFASGHLVQLRVAGDWEARQRKMERAVLSEVRWQHYLLHQGDEHVGGVVALVLLMMISYVFARFSKMIVVGKQGGCLPHAIR